MYLTTNSGHDVCVVCCRVGNQKFEVDPAISGG